MSKNYPFLRFLCTRVRSQSCGEWTPRGWDLTWTKCSSQAIMPISKHAGQLVYGNVKRWLSQLKNIITNMHASWYCHELYHITHSELYKISWIVDTDLYIMWKYFLTEQPNSFSRPIWKTQTNTHPHLTLISFASSQRKKKWEKITCLCLNLSSK